MGTETAGALHRRLAVALAVASVLLLCGVLVSRKFYIGQLPTVPLCMMLGLAGSWLTMWPKRRTASGRVAVLALTTATALAVLSVVLSVSANAR